VTGPAAAARWRQGPAICGVRAGCARGRNVYYPSLYSIAATATATGTAAAGAIATRPAVSWPCIFLGCAGARGVGGRFWGSSWLVLAGARSHRYFIGEKPLTLKPLTLKPFSDRIRLRTSRSHKFRTLPAWKKARCMDIQTCHSCSAQNSAGSTALMRTEPSSSSSVHMTTAQHRSPVRPLVTATPSRVPFFFTVSVPASESSSRRSTSPSP
jgi:hypothetical protein